MSAVTLPTRPRSIWREAVAFAWRAWSSTPPRRWVLVLSVGLLISLVMLPHRLEMIQRVGWHPLPAITVMALPLLASLIMFLGWALADAGDDRWARRNSRVVHALFGAGAVAAVAGISIFHLSGADELVARLAAEKGKGPPSVPLMLMAEYMNLLLVGGVIYAVAEVAQRRCHTQREFEAAVRERGALEHQVLESKLSAMQAQVEPRFLFDTLVDIEALYEKAPQHAAANLDRLISYLRAALPRLRESGSTIEAELELVKAYLEVVTALHGGRPALSIELAEDCRHNRFYPMLLLPLIQRAVRHPSGVLPASISIDVRREARDTVLALRIALAGGCQDDPELARVRERLAGLYGPAATLQCVELASEEVTALTLRIPANGAAATR
jgi:Histidine kinase